MADYRKYTIMFMYDGFAVLGDVVLNHDQLNNVDLTRWVIAPKYEGYGNTKQLVAYSLVPIEQYPRDAPET